MTSIICHVFYNDILQLQSDRCARSKSTLKTTKQFVVFLVVVTDVDYGESQIILMRKNYFHLALPLMSIDNLPIPTGNYSTS